MVRGGTDRRYRYKFFYLDDLNPRFTLYVLGTEYQQRSPGKRSAEPHAQPDSSAKQIKVNSPPHRDSQTVDGHATKDCDRVAAARGCGGCLPAIPKLLWQTVWGEYV